MNKIILIFSCCVLSSCVGSYIVFEDNDPKAFETLHAVPERYNFTSLKVHTKEEEQLKSEHQKNLLEGEIIRKKAHLVEESSSQVTPSKEK